MSMLAPFINGLARNGLKGNSEKRRKSVSRRVDLSTESLQGTKSTVGFTEPRNAKYLRISVVTMNEE